MEPNGNAQVAVFVDFENLVLGAVKELPDQANPAPYEAITRLCRGYGNASVRRAYADWANPRFGGHQDDLAMNGVDLIQVARVGIQNKNAADIRMAVDAMETLIVHPEVSVFVLVSGDGDYSPLVQRLREFGKWVVGVGTEANASRKLVSVCSEYKYWGTLVAEVEPDARPAAAFDISEAEQLLVRAFEESSSETLTAGGLKSKMLALDPAFDEHNYGARSFRAFLTLLPKRVQVVETSGPDITVKLIEKPAARPARTRPASPAPRSVPGSRRLLTAAPLATRAGRDRGPAAHGRRGRRGARPARARGNELPLRRRSHGRRRGGDEPVHRRGERAGACADSSRSCSTAIRSHAAKAAGSDRRPFHLGPTTASGTSTGSSPRAGTILPGVRASERWPHQ